MKLEIVMALNASICKSYRVHVDAAGTNQRSYRFVCTYVHDCKYVAGSNKTFFLKLYTPFNNLYLALIMKYLNSLDNTGMKSYLQSSHISK